MSFEGYYQIICENGHYSCADVHAFDMFGIDSDWKCDECYGALKWFRLVETNKFSGYGLFGSYDVKNRDVKNRDDLELEIDKSADTFTCEKCGYTHKISAGTYKIPEGVGIIVE